jgi:hypothetical protein
MRATGEKGPPSRVITIREKLKLTLRGVEGNFRNLYSQGGDDFF